MDADEKIQLLNEIKNHSIRGHTYCTSKLNF